ncbi:FAD:protein FMN transferase [Sesbania bispinosa]|nr:FAD:protein FMN transferase [Sesbania bispinosa]
MPSPPTRPLHGANRRTCNNGTTRIGGEGTRDSGQVKGWICGGGLLAFGLHGRDGDARIGARTNDSSARMSGLTASALATTGAAERCAGGGHNRLHHIFIKHCCPFPILDDGAIAFPSQSSRK